MQSPGSGEEILQLAVIEIINLVNITADEIFQRQGPQGFTIFGNEAYSFR